MKRTPCSLFAVGKRRNWAFLFVLTISTFALSSHVVTGQQSSVFADAQAQRGQNLYEKRCASCHGAQLSGGSSVPLAGRRFMEKWGQGNHNVDELYFITRTQMPYGAAGTMTNQQYIDVVAYLLKANGYKAGDRPLPMDAAALKKIIIKPQSASQSETPETQASDRSNPKMPASGSLRPTVAMPSQQELNTAHSNSTDWLLTNHDYTGQRFVDLKQITRQNAATLRPVAMYQAGDTNTFHTNPLVYRGVMYLTTANSTIALDAATGQLKWRYDWRLKGKPGWPSTLR